MQFFGGWVLTVDVSLKRFEDIERENREAREESERRMGEHASRWRVTKSQSPQVERDKPVTRRQALPAPKKLCPICKKRELTGRKQTCGDACRQAKSRQTKRTATKKRRS